MNVLLRDVAQLADKVRKIEQIKYVKELYQWFNKSKKEWLMCAL